ncbi:YheC/YheD family endospore coat-associated protein [Alicyclobacillus fastidiosus]|uniref:YheC/YheD family protein n=1 Tax=Alicyclobacillus fastidiosus TaxID=392011 RepID=A0ABV5AD64_9BACL|nr:YheC/YheD family protein [Alicyclobacillus fastidiosus]WEH08831.1 YheC/YheD family protein [Alicyclobacillus fastidiosus]
MRPRIGYLHIRRDPLKIRKVYAFQAVAQLEGAELFYFSPRRIHLETKTIDGLVYEGGRYRERTMPFPDVIYNDSYPRSRGGARLVDALFEVIPRTSHSVGDKMSVYRRIQEGKAYAHYLIPSRSVQVAKDVVEYANEHRRIVLKPVVGHQGKGIVCVHRQQDGRYLLISDGESTVHSASQLAREVDKRLAGSEHLMQPFIVSKTRDGVTYDFRVHVQKDRHGRWTPTAVYPRLAGRHGPIPNLSSGGQTMIPNMFFEHEFGDDSSQMRRTLEQFGVGLAEHLEVVSGQAYDELGIDVGLDERNRIWLFEVNWRPGPPPIWYLELDVARNAIGYAMYLAESRRRGRK